MDYRTKGIAIFQGKIAENDMMCQTVGGVLHIKKGQILVASPCGGKFIAGPDFAKHFMNEEEFVAWTKNLQAEIEKASGQSFIEKVREALWEEEWDGKFVEREEEEEEEEQEQDLTVSESNPTLSGSYRMTEEYYKK